MDTRLPLQVPDFILERVAKISGYPSKFRSRLTQHASQFGQLLRAENHQGDDEKNDNVGHAQHFSSSIILAGSK
jgi:hypothetical protein